MLHGSLKAYSRVFLLYSLVLISDGETQWDWSLCTGKSLHCGFRGTSTAGVLTHLWIAQVPHLLLLFTPAVLSSAPNVVLPQTGIPLYKHQRCPSRLLPSSPSGSQFIFLSVSAGDILFQHEIKSLLKSKSFQQHLFHLLS